MTGSRCSRGKCDGTAVARGLCRGHYDAFRAARAGTSEFRGGVADIDEVRQHIAALRDCGLGFHQIAKLSTVPAPTIQGIVYQQRSRVWASTAQKLLDVAVPTSPHLVAAPNAFVDATGTVRRLRALTVLGHTNRSIAGRTGLTEKQLSPIALGKQRYVFARVAVVIDAAFLVMQFEFPADTTATRRAKDRAQRRGWVSAMAWDEVAIDDPDAKPDLGPARRGGSSERIASCTVVGITDAETIAEKLGIQPKSVERQIHRMKEAS